MNGITLKAVDPTAEDHLVFRSADALCLRDRTLARSTEIAAILGMTEGSAMTRFMEWRPRSLYSGRWVDESVCRITGRGPLTRMP